MAMLHDRDELEPTQSKQYLQSTEFNSSLISEAAFPFSSVAISFYFSENENFKEILIYLHSLISLPFSTNKENGVSACLAATQC